MYAYICGFIDKCAEHNIDPVKLAYGTGKQVHDIDRFGVLGDPFTDYPKRGLRAAVYLKDN